MSNQIDRLTGATVQHYRIAERLGAGGMGEVYLAEDIRLGRQVALKFLGEGLEGDTERRARLLTEARAASSLRSSNIAAIYDIGEHEGSIFIVMELVEGELLSRKVERGPLAVREAVDIALQLADALEEAHAHGVIHRDIKSANVMITPRGQVKVLDFGLARFIPRPGDTPSDTSLTTIGSARQTLPGILLGTLLYMSPEQALAKPADHRSDIFSLGVVLYEMLTGRLPFAGGTLTEVVDRLLHETPPAVARFNYEVPPELDAIVRKTLEKNVDFRYQSARDLYIDLHNVLAQLDPSREHSRRSPLLEGARSFPAAAAASETPANSIAVMTFSNITKEPSDDWIGSGIAETVTADLKNIAGLSVIGRERIFDALRNLSSSELTGVDERFAIDIGRGLAATWIVAGGYQRSAEQLRITARLVSIKTGALIKTVKIDGRISDIFELQDKIVYELSQSLNLDLNRNEIAEIERDETRSVDAYESYSRGMMTLRLASRDSLDRAIYLFEKAIERDANYAEAWAALGGALELKASFLTLPELYDKAIAALRKAIDLNPRLVRSHSWLGAALLATRKWDDAVMVLEGAARLEPNSPSAHAALARAYWIGKGDFDKGIRELEQVVSLNPEGGYAYLQLGLLYGYRGEFDRAELACRKAIALQEQYLSGTEGLLVIGGHTRLGWIHYRRREFDDAIREYQRELMFLSSSDHALKDRTLIELNQKIGAASLRKGDSESAERHFKLAVKGFEERVAKGADDPFTKYYIACLYALRDEIDPAIRYLRETLEALPALTLRRARLDPDFDPVRHDPQFIALMGEQDGTSPANG